MQRPAGRRGDPQPTTAQPTTDTTDAASPINVTNLGGPVRVAGGSADESMLWTAHHPAGTPVTVEAFNSPTPLVLTLMEGHVFQGADIIGDVRRDRLIGLDGQLIATPDGSGTTATARQGFGINRAIGKWPGGVTPYVFGASATANIRSQFEQDVNIYNTQTGVGVRFVPRGNEANYVRVKADSGCYSYVGMMDVGFKPNGQEVGLGSDGCGVGGALHETGHVTGLKHEQNRADRDTFINIRFDLILTDGQSQYALNLDSNRTAHTTYDFRSCMTATIRSTASGR